MSIVRSVRFLDDEAEALEKLSDERRATVNSLVRIAVRTLVGLPVPAWADQIMHPKGPLND